MGQYELAAALGRRFIQRKDITARQHADGTWAPWRTPLTMEDMYGHLEGKITMGHYLVGTDDRTKLFALDLDLNKTGFWRDVTGDPNDDGERHECNPREIWLDRSHPGKPYFTIQLRCLAEGLAMRAHRTGLLDHVALSSSGGKGVHVYGFFDEPIPAAEAKGIALAVLESFGCFEAYRGDCFWQHSGVSDYKDNISIEVFPKQESLEGKELGNLMKLPLGINRKTGARAEFLDCRVGYNRLKKMDPQLALGGLLPWD